MKKLFLLASLVLSACAPYNEFKNLKNDVRNVESENERQQREIDSLKAVISNMENSIMDLSAQAAVNVSLTGAEINQINATVAALQAQANAQTVALAVLEAQESVVEFVDPCGDGPGFDEILIRMKSGKLVAYFENGGKRFLTVLTPGAYLTTDVQACQFTVNADLSVQ